MNKEAAVLIAQSCQEKYPASLGERTLSFEELSKLDGRAGLSFGNYYSASLYNGNKSLTVTHVEISVTTKISGQESTKIYLSQVHIKPMTSVDFGFNIIVGDAGSGYEWAITSAKGVNN